MSFSFYFKGNTFLLTSPRHLLLAFFTALASQQKGDLVTSRLASPKASIFDKTALEKGKRSKLVVGEIHIQKIIFISKLLLFLDNAEQV